MALSPCVPSFADFGKFGEFRRSGALEVSPSRCPMYVGGEIRGSVLFEKLIPRDTSQVQSFGVASKTILCVELHLRLRGSLNAAGLQKLLEFPSGVS